MTETKVNSILLIDDDEDEYDMIIEAIHTAGKDVDVSFLDRQENCHLYKERHFDLILLDINMPYQDGFAWLRKIREKNSEIPVVMYSNSSNPGHISRAYQSGANLFFNKPDSFSSLVKSISKLLELDWSLPLDNVHLNEGRFKV